MEVSSDLTIAEPTARGAILPLPLTEAIDFWRNDVDLVVLGRLQNVVAAIGDFRRVLVELPANTPIAIRAAADEVLSNL